MKATTLSVVFAAAVFALACGGDDALERDQQQYEVVQEGAGGAVTSTIHAPGEVMPPLTATNADTTTAFTLPGSTTDMTTDPLGGGSLADTLPREPSYPPVTRTPSPPPAPVPQPPPPSEPQPRPEQEPQPSPAPQPQPPPPTETTSTTETRAPEPPPPTATREPQREEPEDDPPPPPPSPEP